MKLRTKGEFQNWNDDDDVSKGGSHRRVSGSDEHQRLCGNDNSPSYHRGDSEGHDGGDGVDGNHDRVLLLQLGRLKYQCPVRELVMRFSLASEFNGVFFRKLKVLVEDMSVSEIKSEIAWSHTNHFTYFF